MEHVSPVLAVGLLGCHRVEGMKETLLDFVVRKGTGSLSLSLLSSLALALSVRLSVLRGWW
jgi:hypothetical protein